MNKTNFPTEGRLDHLPDFYDHTLTLEKKAPLWFDGSPIPWMTYPAISYLNQLDFTDKSVFEYGSGYSTLYWAQRSKRVVAVENDEQWIAKFASDKPENAEVFFASGREYVERVAYKAPHDVISIDGRWRYDCAMESGTHLADGGLIILDNAERYPVMTEHFRKLGFIQVDMIGNGPQNLYVWCTSLFLSRDFAFCPSQALQPHAGPGMTSSIEVKPVHKEDNKPGAYG